MHKIPDIEPFKKKLGELDDQMSAPDFFSDPIQASIVSKEHQRISSLIEKIQKHKEIEAQILDNKILLEDEETEKELLDLIRDDQKILSDKKGLIEKEIFIEMIPPDPSDSRNSVMEIRGGAGGDEANIFAGDLFRMYSRYAEQKKWKVEIMGSNISETGGFREIIFNISGEDAYKYLKFESGVHRVQRVPATETQGRVHTSTATVAVLPEAQEVDIDINASDLEISTMRASGAGGQHVNTTDSAVQLVHKPSGVTVYCADERSQHKNKAKAMVVLRARLLKAKEEEENAKYAAERKGQIGTGDRSERIRTYNFPQGRVTDHRIAQNFSLQGIVEGQLEILVKALQDFDCEAKLNNLLEK